jgi:hypothetical protein
METKESHLVYDEVERTRTSTYRDDPSSYLTIPIRPRLVVFSCQIQVRKIGSPRVCEQHYMEHRRDTSSFCRLAVVVSFE